MGMDAMEFRVQVHLQFENPSREQLFTEWCVSNQYREGVCHMMPQSSSLPTIKDNQSP